MRAVVLVGGFGTRLRPLTLTRPKQMLPVGSRTMLERVVDRLGEVGVTEVVLSLGYQPDVFIAAFPDGRVGGVDLHYAVEPEPLDTAGAIAFAARDAGIDDTFLALNGDVLTDLDVADLWVRHVESGGEATIALTPVDDPSRYGVVVTGDDGAVTAFVEKPAPGTEPSRWVNAGTYVLEPSFLDRVAPGARSSIEREVFPQLVADRSLYAVQSDVYWIDAGTPEAYLQANLDLVGRQRARTAAADGVGVVEPPVDPTASVDPTATVEGSVIGPGVVVGPGATVSGSVVMAGTSVGSDARVLGSILGYNTKIQAGAVVADLSVVGDDQEVAAGARVSAETVPPPSSWA